ncbi:hypothetical protein KR018_000108 [Drosophila ironensis]|nr:hypothetical protein KR018_000108 [Drosophila ironensis]
MLILPVLPCRIEPTPCNPCHFVAGSLAGLIEVICLHPLDVVKTRMQMRIPKSKQQELVYHGLINAMVKMRRQEGISAFWKGVVPPLVVETPKRGFKFMGYEYFKKYFMFGHSEPSRLTYACTGAFVGFLEALLTTPFEVIKIIQQVHRHRHLKTMSVVKYTIQKKGLGRRGLYRGLSAMMFRNTVFHFGFFGIYHGLRDSASVIADPFYRGIYVTLSALLSSSVSAIVSLPLDLAKSRIQGPQPVKGEVKYQYIGSTLRTTVREEGFRALFKGITPVLMRSCPGGAFLLLAHEYFNDILRTTIFKKG